MHNLPIYYWERLWSENDYGAILKRPQRNINCLRLQNIAERLFNQYIVEVGLSGAYIDYLEKKKEIYGMQQEYIAGDYHVASFIDIALIELEALEKQIGGQEQDNINKACAYARKYTHTRVVPKETGTIEFYSIFKLIEEENNTHHGSI